MVFSTVAIVDRIIVVIVGDGGSVTSVGSKGVVREGVSVGNGEKVVKDVFIVAMCRQFGL